MNFLFQFSVFSLIVFSFVLVIGFPVVVLGSSSSTTFALSWKENKKKIFIGIGLWFLLIFIVGILNSFFV